MGILIEAWKPLNNPLVKKCALKPALGLLLCLCVTSCTSEKPEVPPNVLFLAVDDFNDYMGFWNGHHAALLPTDCRWRR